MVSDMKGGVGEYVLQGCFHTRTGVHTLSDSAVLGSIIFLRSFSRSDIMTCTGEEEESFLCKLTWGGLHFIVVKEDVNGLTS